MTTAFSLSVTRENISKLIEDTIMSDLSYVVPTVSFLCCQAKLQQASINPVFQVELDAINATYQETISEAIKSIHKQFELGQNLRSAVTAELAKETLDCQRITTLFVTFIALFKPELQGYEGYKIFMDILAARIEVLITDPNPPPYPEGWTRDAPQWF